MSREHRDKERKHSKKSSSSSSRRSSRKEEEDRSSRHKSHKSRYEKENTKLPKGAKKVTNEDFFLRQTEFRVWLAQSKGKYVDDLSTEEATELFTDEFAKKWNRGKLSKMFYEGLPESVVEQTKRTRHRWGFVAKLGEKEKFELATAKDSVGVATRRENLLSSGRTRESTGKVSASSEESKSNPDKRREKEDEEDNREDDRKRRKLERRKEREYRDTVMEELAPKATGREAQIEKRRQLGDKLHGSAKDREDSRDGLDFSDDFLMGGGRGAGGDDLKRRMAQRDSARRRKQDEQQEKLAELKAKESARMDKFLEGMGLAGPNANGGKPMMIPPRR